MLEHQESPAATTTAASTVLLRLFSVQLTYYSAVNPSLRWVTKGETLKIATTDL